MLANVPYCPMYVEIKDHRTNELRVVDINDFKKYFKSCSQEDIVPVRNLSILSYSNVYTPILSISRCFIKADYSSPDGTLFSPNGTYIGTANGTEAVFSNWVYLPIADEEDSCVTYRENGITYRAARYVSRNTNSLFFEKDNSKENPIAFTESIMYTGWCYNLQTENHYYKVNNIVVYDHSPRD